MKRREFLKGAALATWAAIWCVPISPNMSVGDESPTGQDEKDVGADSELSNYAPTSPYWVVNDFFFEDYLEDLHPSRPA